MRCGGFIGAGFFSGPIVPTGSLFSSGPTLLRRSLLSLVPFSGPRALIGLLYRPQGAMKFEAEAKGV